MKYIHVALLVTGTLGLVSVSACETQYVSTLPKLGQPFTAVYAYSHKASGMPADTLVPPPVGTPELGSDVRKQLNLPSAGSISKDEQLLTVSSNESSSLYMWSTSSTPEWIVIFDPKHTSRFGGSVTASYRSGLDLTVLPHDLPPMPFQLPSAASNICLRPKESAMDSMVNNPPIGTRVYILHALAYAGTSLPYIEGYSERTSGADWDHYWAGSVKRPNYILTMVGRQKVGTTWLPERMEVTSVFNLSTADGKDPEVKTVDSYRLLSATPTPLPSPMFHLESYLTSASMLDNGKIVTPYNPALRSLEAQFQVESSPVATKHSSSGAVLAVILATVLIALIGLALWKRARLRV